MRLADRGSAHAGGGTGAAGATTMNQSAFIVRVPEAEPHVATLRERLDPSARLGVPAHITVLYPFMAPEHIDAALVAKVRAIATATAPFVFRLARIGRFTGTLYLAPDPPAPFIALTLALVRAFPGHLPYGGQHEGIVPHLTVAQADAAQLHEAETQLRANPALGRGISAVCRELVLIENSSGRWLPMHLFALGRAGDPMR